MNKTFFITGASGFIGSNLINKLYLGNKVYALVRDPQRHVIGGIENIVGDILSPESYEHELKGCDILFHCAAFISFRKKDFDEAYRVNVEGTRNVLEAAYVAGVKKVVHLSACAVLGFSDDKNKVLDETADPVIRKDNVYAYIKKLAEEEVQKYVKKGLDVSIANISTVYGQGDRKMNSGSIIKTI